MDREKLNVLMSETVPQRAWNNFKKYLTRWWFVVAQIIMGAIAILFGEPRALWTNLLLCLGLFILASVLAPWRQRNEVRRALKEAAPIYDADRWLSLEKEFRSIEGCHGRGSVGESRRLSQKMECVGKRRTAVYAASGKGR